MHTQRKMIFGKYLTFLGEKSRLDKAYRNAGLQLGQEFIDANGAKQIFNDEYLKKLQQIWLKIMYLTMQWYQNL